MEDTGKKAHAKGKEVDLLSTTYVLPYRKDNRC